MTMGGRSSRALWAAKLAGKSTGQGTPEPIAPGLRPAFTGRIIGIDPSVRATGIAVVEFIRRNEGRLLYSATLRMPQKLSLYECIGRVSTAVAQVVADYKPTSAAIEQTVYIQNFQTAHNLGAMRGATIVPLAQAGIPVNEYAPLRIKQAVSGGRASKEQVAAQVKALLGLPEALPFDESDAAATALCHAYTAAISL